MNKILVALSLMLSFGMAPLAMAAGSADVPVAASSSAAPGTSGNGKLAAQGFSNLSFIGAPVYRIEVSTPVDTPVLLLGGQGLLYSVRCSSGQVGAYGLFFDSASPSGITVATSGKALTSQVLSSGQIAVSASSQTVSLSNDGGFDAHNAPIPFNNGLVGIVHGSALNCVVQARLMAGNNPGP